MKVKELIKELKKYADQDAEVFVSVDFDSALDTDGDRVFGKVMSAPLNPHHNEVYLLSHADEVTFDVPPADETNKKIRAFNRRTRKS